MSVFTDKGTNELRREIISYTAEPFSLHEEKLLYYKEMFEGWIADCFHNVESYKRHPEDTFFLKEIERDNNILPEIKTAVQNISDHLELVAKLTAAAVPDYKAGTKVKINRSFRIGEYEVKAGMIGTRARVDSFTQSRVPAGRIPIRFKVQLFNFIPDEGFRTLVLYIPNFSVDAI